MAVSCEKEFTLVINPNIFHDIPWVLSTGTAWGAMPSATGGDDSVLLYMGLPIPYGAASGWARATFHPVDGAPWWTVDNTGGPARNCMFTVAVNVVSHAPYVPKGILTQGFDSYIFEQLTPVAQIIGSHPGGSLVTGNYSHAFTVPAGVVSTWAGRFYTGGQGFGSPPQPSASVSWAIDFAFL